jgi:uncharacterized membrane protein
MAPLIFLLATFVILFLVNKFVLNGRLTLSFIGRASMAVMLTVTGVTHFTHTDWMAGMMPEFMPAKRELVYFTGVCELLAVVGLVWDRFSRLTSIMLIIFFVAILPANIAERIQAVNADGLEFGLWYLLFRVPLQIFFIWWVYYFGLRKNRLEP